MFDDEFWDYWSNYDNGPIDTTAYNQVGIVGSERDQFNSLVGNTMNTDIEEFSSDTSGASPLLPGQTGTSGGFWDSLWNSLGNTAQNLTGTALNNLNAQGNQLLNTSLPANQQAQATAQANANAAKNQQIALLVFVGLGIAGLVYLAKKS